MASITNSLMMCTCRDKKPELGSIMSGNTTSMSPAPTAAPQDLVDQPTTTSQPDSKQQSGDWKVTTVFSHFVRYQLTVNIR